MLKIRIIPIMLWNGIVLVKGQNFKNNRRATGSPITTIQIYNSRDVDEIIFFDISENEKKEKNFDFIRSITDCTSVPLTLGGNIKTVDQMSQLFENGADKISINSALYDNPKLINYASKKFGSQAISVSIDVKKNFNEYVCYYKNGTKKSDKNFKNWVIECVDRGAGELIINSIDHDGLMQGYDNNLISTVTSLVDVPVIASGGAGNYDHFYEAYKSGASGLAAASIFHFTEVTPNKIKNFLFKKNVPIRENFFKN